LRVAIIGYGKVGRGVSKVLQKDPAFTVARVIDRNAQVAEAGARELNITTWSQDPADAFRFSNVDAVVIATPHADHAALTESAIYHHKHVFLQPPLALRSPDAARVLSMAETSGLVVAVDFWTRSAPGIRFARGKIPRPTFLQIESIVDPLHNSWPGEAVHGGVLAYNGSHALDLACYLAASRPLHVQAAGGRHTRRAGLADTISGAIRFANGALARVIVGEFGHSQTFSSWRVLTADAAGTVTANNGLANAVSFGNGRSDSLAKDVEADCESSFKRSLTAFAKAVKGDGKPLADITDGARAVQLADAIYEAMVSGNRITL
jgi:1,5-anhydro-D-fructose reductase (1,5-anhydro-D-mannitol-forming)